MQTRTSHAAELGFDETTLRSRLDFFRIGEDDLARLARLRPFALEVTEGIVAQFYDHLLAQPETREFLHDPELVERLKRKQTVYFHQLFGGRVDLAYVEDRLQVGAVHARLGVAPRWYIGAYSHYLDLVHQRLAARKVPPEETLKDGASVDKMLHFDASLAIDAYIAGHLDAQSRQQAAIRELSTPVIRVYDRVLLLPLVGTIDSHRAQHIMESVLERIGEEHALVLLLDIAGVVVVDTQVADDLLRTTAAVRLLGAHPILTGISPQVARTLIQLGVDLSGLDTRNKLSDGLELALAMVGRKVERAQK